MAKRIHNVDRSPEASTELPAAARQAVDRLADQLRETQAQIDQPTDRIEAVQRTDPLARRLAAIPGIGAITASAIAATTPEVDTVRPARDVFVGEPVHRTVSRSASPWLGRTPQPQPSGGTYAS